MREKRIDLFKGSIIGAISSVFIFQLSVLLYGMTFLLMVRNYVEQNNESIVYEAPHIFYVGILTALTSCLVYMLLDKLGLSKLVNQTSVGMFLIIVIIQVVFMIQL